ncbi:hypothetical protein SLEP1_g34888 [Rubroshorea leprosula]|uniref:Uncharacterized protein n=1 Tax=Rubroshorea leprosula TaxID=152421 RepID=A0AAV5KLH2_9ROSI|nr:hypothetical protein SLEP1_g34888 [Rubroshorea leprosula]
MFYHAMSSPAVIIAFTATAQMLDKYGGKVGFVVPTISIFIFDKYGWDDDLPEAQKTQVAFYAFVSTYLFEEKL